VVSPSDSDGTSIDSIDEFQSANQSHHFTLPQTRHRLRGSNIWTEDCPCIGDDQDRTFSDRDSLFCSVCVCRWKARNSKASQIGFHKMEMDIILKILMEVLFIMVHARQDGD
jgi:hypothetical protein